MNSVKRCHKKYPYLAVGPIGKAIVIQHFGNLHEHHTVTAQHVQKQHGGHQLVDWSVVLLGLEDEPEAKKVAGAQHGNEAHEYY